MIASATTLGASLGTSWSRTGPGVDDRRQHLEDVDAVRLEFGSQRAGERVRGGFGGRVHGEAGDGGERDRELT